MAVPDATGPAWPAGARPARRRAFARPCRCRAASSAGGILACRSTWAEHIAWPQAARLETRLHNLSRGGARLLHMAPEPAGRRGRLHVPGLSLPVPFTVVGSRPETGLHIRFDLEGMGLDALEQQFEALLSRD